MARIFLEIDIFESDSKSARQNTTYKLVYEIDFEKNAKTGPPYHDMTLTYAFKSLTPTLKGIKQLILNHLRLLRLSRRSYRAKATF